MSDQNQAGVSEADQPAAAAGGQPPILFAHKDHLVTFTDGEVEAPVTAKTVVFPGDDVVDVVSLQRSAGQTRLRGSAPTSPAGSSCASEGRSTPACR